MTRKEDRWLELSNKVESQVKNYGNNFLALSRMAIKPFISQYKELIHDANIVESKTDLVLRHFTATLELELLRLYHQMEGRHSLELKSKIQRKLRAPHSRLREFSNGSVGQ